MAAGGGGEYILMPADLEAKETASNWGRWICSAGAALRQYAFHRFAPPWSNAASAAKVTAGIIQRFIRRNPHSQAPAHPWGR